MFYGTGQEPIVSLGVGGLIGAMLSIGLALGVVLAVGGLLVIQLLSVMRNETGIESWIKNKAEYRERELEEEFVYPYNVGRWRNLRMVLHFGERKELDGIWWPVRPQCNQYTLTVEQIKQKQQKRCHSVVYTATTRFNGSICPCGYGCRVCCCPPCLDEQRVRLEPGDQILVSRFRKHWLYGDKMLNSNVSADKTVKRERGWFPRKCAIRESNVAAYPDHLPFEYQRHDQNSSGDHPSGLSSHPSSGSAPAKRNRRAEKKED